MAERVLISRRAFVGAGLATAGALTVPALLTRRAGAQPANDRINLGFIGTGGRGQWLMDAFMGQPDTQITAVCDVDRGHAEAAKGKVAGATVYHDFRELVAHPALDAVVIASPDHWHALHSIAALRAGLHVYCEKPLANSVPEGRAIVEAAKAAGKVFQVGSHERSTSSARQACELVRNGRLGEVRRVVINLPCDDPHHAEARAFKGIPPAEPVPDGFDYDFWLGHAPQAPYCARRCHFWWRFNLAYGGGEMTDRGAHVLDIAQLGMGLDNTGPVKVEAYGVQNKDSLYNTFWDYRFAITYDNGVTFDGGTDGPRGLRFEGTEGTLFVAIHGGAPTADPARLWTDEDSGPVKLGRSPGHQRDFLDCVKSGAETMAPVEAGHRTASLCHLANIAMLTRRPLRYDPVAERIIGDAQANALLAPYMRAPWKL